MGFQHDRRLALRALALSASKSDVHSVFSGLVLMTYHGVVLLMSGWQADVERIVREYESIVARYVSFLRPDTSRALTYSVLCIVLESRHGTPKARCGS